VIPIHGEIRHLRQHKALAEQIGIPSENIGVIENGQVIEFSEGVMRLAEKVPASYVFVDGSSVGDVDSDVVRQRELLSRGGIVLISVVLKKADGSLLAEPGVVSKGFILEHESEDVFTQVRQKVAEAVKTSSNGDMQKNIEQSARNYLYEETRRRPMVFVIISYV
jgi:ribonuclease J